MRKLLAFIILLSLAGCDSAGISPKIAAKYEPDYRSQVELIDGRLDPSSERILTGDTRPLWIVHGHIRNNNPERSLSEVRMRFNIYLEHNGKREYFDQADLTVNDIGALSAKGFRQTVQFLPPKGNWQIETQIISASVE